MSTQNIIPQFESFVVTQGNIMHQKEREYRLNALIEEITRDWVDKEIIPYLKRINNFPFLITTQSCCGHNTQSQPAHIDFRSMLSEAETINQILRPLDAKRNPPDIGIQLMVEPYGIRYCLWLKNDAWREQIEDFISILEKVKI